MLVSAYEEPSQDFSSPQHSSSNDVEHKGQDKRQYTKWYGAFGTERLGQFTALLAALKHENETLRKPCPTCGNLVRPELLDQHNEAYHSPRN